MKLIIAGTRTRKLTAYEIANIVYAHGISVTEVVSGTASGIDQCGEAYAMDVSRPIKRFPADWLAHGKSAGPIRNRKMAEYADALLLIWDGKSKGSANMRREMLKLHKPVYEVILA